MIVLKGIYLPEDLWQKGRRKSEKEKLSFSKYVESLIFKDLMANKAVEFPKLDKENNE